MALENEVPHVVQCKSTHPFFETIAAFDVANVAEKYMCDCARTNPNFDYRVCDLSTGKVALAVGGARG